MGKRMTDIKVGMRFKENYGKWTRVVEVLGLELVVTPDRGPIQYVMVQNIDNGRKSKCKASRFFEGKHYDGFSLIDESGAV